jgi:hypothetical protein
MHRHLSWPSTDGRQDRRYAHSTRRARPGVERPDASKAVADRYHRRGKATMTTLLRLLADYGLAVAFFNVLLAQLGVPLPAYPILIVTGALSVQGASRRRRCSRPRSRLR